MIMRIVLPEFIDVAIYYMDKELIIPFISKLASAIAGEKPFNSGSEVDNWLSQQDTKTLLSVLSYTADCATR